MKTGILQREKNLYLLYQANTAKITKVIVPRQNQHVPKFKIITNKQSNNHYNMSNRKY